MKKEEIVSVVFPVIFGVKAPAKHNGMNVWMEVHFTPPGMENADVPNVSTEIFAVGRQFPQCIGRCAIKGGIQTCLVTVDDRIEFFRDSEDHMEVWCI